MAGFGSLMEAGRDDPGMPRGIGNAYGFSVLNALSFQMVLGGPMVLYAKALGADRKSTRLNSSHEWISRMPSSA